MLDSVLARLGRLNPVKIDLSLDRMRRLLAALGHPEDRLPPVIHVAGTNGKGSVVAFLRAIFETHGQSVHAYTSPHLVRFAERVRIAGRLPDDDTLAEVLERVERINAGQPITFFEATTAGALLAFAETPADVCLLETGLGGRLDATNVIASTAAAVLAPIGLDHREFLGDTLAKIAWEKACIMKPGAPAVSARQEAEAARVIAAHAAETGAPLWLGGRDWDFAATAAGFAVRAPGLALDLPRPALEGAWQVANAALALAAARASGLVPLEAAACARAMESVAWPGRMQRVPEGAVARAAKPHELWLDGGHNPHAAAAIAPLLAEMAASGPLHLILGMQTTKDPAGWLARVVPHVASIRTVPVRTAPAPFAAEALAAFARAAGHPRVAAAESWGKALTDVAAREPAGRVLIAGSLYLVGEVLAANGPGAPE